MLFTGTDVFWKPASLPPCTAARRQTRSDQSPEPGAAQQACCAPTAPPRGRAELRAAPPPWAPDRRLDKGASALLCLLRGLCVAFMSAVDRVHQAPSKQTAVRDGVRRWLAWPGCRRGLAGAGAGAEQRELNRRRGCEARICLVSSRGFLSWIKAQARGSRNRPPGDASALRGPLLLAFLLALDASSEASPAPALETRGRETWGEIRLRPASRERPLRALGRDAGAAPLHGKARMALYSAT